MIKDFKDFLGIPKEKENKIFRAILTHCDFDADAKDPEEDD